MPHGFCPKLLKIPEATLQTFAKSSRPVEMGHLSSELLVGVWISRIILAISFSRFQDDVRHKPSSKAETTLLFLVGLPPSSSSLMSRPSSSSSSSRVGFRFRVVLRGVLGALGGALARPPPSPCPRGVKTMSCALRRRSYRLALVAQNINNFAHEVRLRMGLNLTRQPSTQFQGLLQRPQS